ncbi:hypothetical protein [Hymenobacter sp. BRD67]|uniref:hypothetical protein n=1 Tax=Hymenobacter sp. BRD67 TaxID=2675877 RepID=UPI001564A040|nr:hypothetical protein [Hymenobacter sp. BRD67]QKG53814.1 hypothetical protein GKZ67_15930 [Hymenobacter sp. BRD67]
MKPRLLFSHLACILALSVSVAQAQTGSISGTVFEDVNYGGGAGRPFGTSGTKGVGTAATPATAATVELYSSAGNYIANTTTSTTAGSLGQYSFTGQAAGNYIVRVVNSTVNSTRPGSVGGLLPVQTFRTNNGASDVNRVGGEAPELQDAGAYVPGTTAVAFNFTTLTNGSDNTIFIDNLSLNSGSIPNYSFETPSVGTGSNAYKYNPTGGSWSFSGNAGIAYASATNNSAFAPPPAPDGSQVAFLQGYNNVAGTIQQSVLLPSSGTAYTLTLRAAQRANPGGAQVVKGTVTINGVTTTLTFTSATGTVNAGNIAPTAAQLFATYTANFTVPAPVNVLSTFTAQSQAPVSLATGSSAVAGVDFGYNFSTIVNSTDVGQGSLRQFIVNSNALTNAGLAQVGQLAGREASIFMIPDGNAHPGQRAALNSGLTGSSGAARALIQLASVLPAITDGRTRIDGTTQTININDSNTGQVGTGGTVGVRG